MARLISAWDVRQGVEDEEWKKGLQWVSQTKEEGHLSLLHTGQGGPGR